MGNQIKITNQNMYKFVISLLTLSSLLIGCKNTEKVSPLTVDDKSVKSVAVSEDGNDVSPKIIGGQRKLRVSYPIRAMKNNTQGVVIWSFIVTKKGEAKDFKLIRGIGDGCDKAVKHALREVKFKPAKRNGKAVKVRYSNKFIFRLQ